MGYDAHITRRVNWSDSSGPEITRAEWEEVKSRHPDVPLAWSNGNLDLKNPDDAQLEQLIALAKSLGAKVQGDDGETYGPGGAAIPAPPPGTGSRIGAWLSGLFAKAPEPVDDRTLGFHKGDRVRDALGQQGVVTRIDVNAEHGLGIIEVKLDDGRIWRRSAVAHGLERVN